MMSRMEIGGVQVTLIGLANADYNEARRYVQYAKEHTDGRLPLTKIEVTARPDGTVDLKYEQRRPFERIRRITGYLTGTLDSWNNSKRAEEHDRVKHEYERG